MSSELNAVWTGIAADTTTHTHDAADAAQVYAVRTGLASDLAGSLVVNERQLPDLRALDVAVPFTLRVSGGAGAIAGACRLAGKFAAERLQSLEISLRDLDDLPGNARRVTVAIDQAYDEGVLSEDVPVYIDVPQPDQHEPGHGWLAAADEVAAVEHRLILRTGAVAGTPLSATLAAWVDAALDRELPFRCTELTRAIRAAAAPDQHGVLNLMVATRAAFDGASQDEVVALLEERDADALTTVARDGELARARRWLTSFGTPDVGGIADDLTDLGLVGAT